MSSAAASAKLKESLKKAKTSSRVVAAVEEIETEEEVDEIGSVKAGLSMDGDLGVYFLPCTLVFHKVCVLKHFETQKALMSSCPLQYKYKSAKWCPSCKNSQTDSDEEDVQIVESLEEHVSVGSLEEHIFTVYPMLYSSSSFTPSPCYPYAIPSHILNLTEPPYFLPMFLFLLALGNKNNSNSNYGYSWERC